MREGESGGGGEIGRDDVERARGKRANVLAADGFRLPF